MYCSLVPNGSFALIWFDAFEHNPTSIFVPHSVTKFWNLCILAILISFLYHPIFHCYTFFLFSPLLFSSDIFSFFRSFLVVAFLVCSCIVDCLILLSLCILFHYLCLLVWCLSVIPLSTQLLRIRLSYKSIVLSFSLGWSAPYIVLVCHSRGNFLDDAPYPLRYCLWYC